MGHRFTTVRRHGSEPSPGLDVSRILLVGFLIAAALGLLSGLGWMGYQILRMQFGG